MDNPDQTLTRLDDDDKALLPISLGEGNSNRPSLGHRAELMWCITEPVVSERDHQAQMVNFGTDQKPKSHQSPCMRWQKWLWSVGFSVRVQEIE